MPAVPLIQKVNFPLL